jgi:hypothetical protein
LGAGHDDHRISDFSLNHSFHVSKTREQMRLGLIQRTQHHEPVRSASVNPSRFGRNNEWLSVSVPSLNPLNVHRSGFSACVLIIASVGALLADSQFA